VAGVCLVTLHSFMLRIIMSGHSLLQCSDWQEEEVLLPSGAWRFVGSWDRGLVGSWAHSRWNNLSNAGFYNFVLYTLIQLPICRWISSFWWHITPPEIFQSNI
jgi:hypothetical protein